MVWGMKLGDLLGVLARGMHVVSLCAGHSRSELVAMGASESFAQALYSLHQVYFGQTAFSGKQRVARNTTHSLETLREIEKYVARVKDSRKAWSLREELCATPEHNIAKVALARLRELRPAPQAAPGVKVLRRKQGPHSLVITDSARAIANMLGTIKATAREQAADALTATKSIFSGDAAAAPALHAHVIVRLDQLATIAAGEGDDIQLPATDGGTTTGAEFIQQQFDDIGFVTLVHPEKGPVNLYRTSRFATEKQRTMLAAEHPRCAWLGCNRPASECQFHHIERWQDGGSTNIDNLVPLCQYHNAINDDDPTKPTGRGRIIRYLGRIFWLPPTGGPPVECPSPAYA